MNEKELFCFPSFLEHLEKKASRTASSKEHDCMRDGHFQTNMPESRQKNSSSINQLEYDVHVVNVGGARTMDW